jgi:hypothetical protein
MKQIDLHDPSSSHYNVKQMCLKYLIIFMMFEKFEIKKVSTFVLHYSEKKMGHEDQSVSSIDQYVHV